jgi:Flp pilus assembly protein TadG
MQTSKIRNRNKCRSILTRRDRTDEKGQAIIELALTMPFLIVLLVGAVEFGWLTYASVEVSNAARAGVAYGSQSATTAGDTTGIKAAAAKDAHDLASGLLVTTVASSCICSNGTASTCLPTDCSTSSIETILTVNTQATLTPLIRLPGFPTPFTLHGRAIQKVLQ